MPVRPRGRRRPSWTMCEPPACTLGAPESIGGLGPVHDHRDPVLEPVGDLAGTRGTTFTPSMFDRAVHRAFDWAFIWAVTSDRRQCPVRLRGASSADRDGAALERALQGRRLHFVHGIVTLGLSYGIMSA